MKKDKNKPDAVSRLGQKAKDTPSIPKDRVRPTLDSGPARKSFEESAEWFRILVEATFEGIAITENGRFTNANRQLADLLGLKLNELIGMPVADLIPEEDRRRVLENIEAGRESVTEHRIIRKDGSLLTVEAHGKTITYQNRPVRVTAIRDITDRKNSEDALRQSEERFRTLAAATSEGIIIAENGIIIEANEQFAQMYGYELAEVIGMSAMEFLAPEERPRVEQVLQKGTDCTGQYRCLHKDGSEFFIEARGRTVERTGQRVRITAIRDITQSLQVQKNLEEARASAQRQAAELNAMFDTLAEPAILYDSAGKVIKANAATVTTFGFDPTLMTADEYKEIPKKLNVHRPDGQPVLASELPSRRALRGEAVRNEELTITNLQGRHITVENSVMPLISDGKIVGAVATWHDITDRKHVEETLRDSEQRFRSLVETTSDWIWAVDENGVYTYASPKVKDLLGYEPQEIIGKTPFDIMPLDEAQRLRQLFADIRDNPKSFTGLENINLHKDGRRVVLETSGVPIFAGKRFAGYRGIDRDITERKHVEETLRQSEERFRILAEAIPGIVWTAKPDGTVDYYNQRWYEYSGLPTDATESNWSKALHPDDLPATAEVWAASVRDEKPYDIEHRLRRADGEYRWHLSRGLPLRDNEGNVVRWFGMAMDIDDQKQTLEEIARLKDELERKNDELESIIRIASHDLRSPLMNIKGFGQELTKDIHKADEMLKGSQLPDNVRGAIEKIFNDSVPEAVRFIQSSADAINSMLASLMQVAKAGTVPINIQNIDMNEMLAEIAANSQFKLKESGGRLTIEHLPSCRGDHDQLTQVFTNLVDNAVKYRDISRPLQIHIYASAEPEKVTYCVEDNGKGIAGEYCEKIFDLFTRLDPDSAKGEGIGLSIVKRMIERQGGKIWVSSKPGNGSKFFVSLPVRCK